MKTRNSSSPWQSQTSDHNIFSFLESYLEHHLLYHTKTPSQTSLHRLEDLSIIRHAFANQQQIDQVSFPLTLSSNVKSNRTFVQTFNHDLNALSDEEEEYSNYLKEYETVIKKSRRKEYVSPEKQNKEMSLLINQFLSDVHDQSQAALNHKKTPTIKTLTNKTQKHPKKEYFGVHVQKFDLTAFQTNRSKAKESESQTSLRSRSPHMDNQKKNQSIVIKRIDINCEKSKGKQIKKDISKQKAKIQVKVKEINHKQESRSRINSNNQIFAINKNADAQMQKQKLDFYKKSQPNQGNYSQQYLKKKQQKQSRVKQSSIYSQSSSIKTQQKLVKKPIKIQIQIPEDELSSELPSEQKDEDKNELDKESAQIMKDISDIILRLLDKTKTATNKHK